MEVTVIFWHTRYHKIDKKYRHNRRTLYEWILVSPRIMGHLIEKHLDSTAISWGMWSYFDVISENMGIHGPMIYTFIMLTV